MKKIGTLCYCAVEATVFDFAALSMVVVYSEPVCDNLTQSYREIDSHSVYSGDIVHRIDTADGGGCFIAYPVDNPRAAKSWFDARITCQYHGGDLTTHVEPVKAWLQKQAVSSLNNGYWIGLQRDPIVWQGKTLNSIRRCSRFESHTFWAYRLSLVRAS